MAQYLDMRGGSQLNNINHLLSSLSSYESLESLDLRRHYSEDFERSRRRYVTFLEEFRTRFPLNKDIVAARSGGRVIFAGEYLDYQHGLVLNAALGMDTVVLLSPRDDRKLCIGSLDFSIDSLSMRPVAKTELHWWDASFSVIQAAKAFAKDVHDKELPGLSILIDSRKEYGGLPIGVGLSSSGALETSLLIAIWKLLGISEQVSISQTIRVAMQSEEQLGFFPGAQDPWACLHSSLTDSEGVINLNLIDCLPQPPGSSQSNVSSQQVSFPNEYSTLIFRILDRHNVSRGRWAHNHSVLESELASMILAKRLTELIDSFPADIEPSVRENIKNYCAHPPYWKPAYFTLEALKGLGVPTSMDIFMNEFYELPDKVLLHQVKDLFGNVSAAESLIGRIEAVDPSIRSREFFFNSAMLHFFGEERRVLESVAALQVGDMQRFFLQQKGTHDSLSKNCRVSNITADRLVSFSETRSDLIAGVRLLGPGGGSNILAWCKTEFTDKTIECICNNLYKEGAVDMFECEALLVKPALAADTLFSNQSL